jgi:hypothetical protein
MYGCSVCNIEFNTKQNYDRHLLTKKHITKVSSNSQKPTSQTNTEILVSIIQQNEELKTMLIEERKLLMEEIKKNQEELKKNQEQQNVLIEYCKEPKIMNQHNQNIQNNDFNLNVFLNVECKDALNITDFIQNLTIEVQDVENVGKLGFVEGITRIIMNGLKHMELTKRPIHCVDVKREVMYVKDENKWEKDKEHSKMKRAIHSVEHKNCQTLCNEMKPPDFAVNESSTEKYMMIMQQVNGGGDREKNHDKIIRSISKQVTIDRKKRQMRFFECFWK